MHYFCDICDKTIKRKSKTKHLKSKNHLHMKSYIGDEHIVGDVYWKDFYRVTRTYVDINRKKFPIFKTVVRCKLFNKDLVICYDKTKKRLIMYGFGDEVFNHLYPVCKEILNRMRRYALLSEKELSLDTVIKNMSITFFSYYYIMTPRHRLEQPRRVLESKLLEHITNLNDDEKNTKYSFLWWNYKPISCVDINMYIHLHRCDNLLNIHYDNDDDDIN